MNHKLHCAKLTENEYNYLIAVPCCRKNFMTRRFVNRPNEYYFVGYDDDICDMRQRLLGLKY